MVSLSVTSRPDGDEHATAGLKVLIVDDHALFSEAVKWFLESEGLAVVECHDTGDSGIRSALSEAPDLALIDMNLPDLDGIAVGERIAAECPGAKIVALTASRDVDLVTRSLRAGFHGFLTKDTPLHDLISAIQTTLSGQVVIPHKLASSAAGARSEEEEQAALLMRQLTPREREVLKLLAKGARGDTIARELGISRNTVRSHVQNVLTKLQVNSRLQAAAFATSYWASSNANAS